MEGVVKHRKMLLRAVVGSPFLKGFKIHVDVTPGDVS